MEREIHPGKTCRICLLKAEELWEMEEIKWPDASLFEILCPFLGKRWLFDDFPRLICNQCTNSAEATYDFIQQCKIGLRYVDKYLEHNRINYDGLFLPQLKQDELIIKTECCENEGQAMITYVGKLEKYDAASDAELQSETVISKTRHKDLEEQNDVRKTPLENLSDAVVTDASNSAKEIEINTAENLLTPLYSEPIPLDLNPGKSGKKSAKRNNKRKMVKIKGKRNLDKFNDNVKPDIVCKKCGKKFKTVRTFYIHKSNHHQKETDLDIKIPMLCCLQCDRHFSCSIDLLKHKQVHDSKLAGENVKNGKIFTCYYDECGIQFSVFECFKQHMTEHHGTLPQKLKKDSEIEMDNINQSKDINERSSRNEEDFEIVGTEQVHIDTEKTRIKNESPREHGPMSGRIKFDAKVGPQETPENRGENSMKKPLEINLQAAPKQIESMEHSTTNQPTESDSPIKGMKFDCSTCKIEFVTNDSLQNHIKTNHSPEIFESMQQLGPFPCSNCDSRFPDIQLLKAHTKLHHLQAVCQLKRTEVLNLGDENEKLVLPKDQQPKDHSFSCPNCDSKFDTLKLLDKHIRVENRRKSTRVRHANMKWCFDPEYKSIYRKYKNPRPKQCESKAQNAPNTRKIKKLPSSPSTLQNFKTKVKKNFSLFQHNSPYKGCMDMHSYAKGINKSGNVKAKRNSFWEKNLDNEEMKEFASDGKSHDIQGSILKLGSAPTEGDTIEAELNLAIQEITTFSPQQNPVHQEITTFFCQQNPMKRTAQKESSYFPCLKCGTRFPSVEGLKDHMVTHYKKRKTMPKRATPKNQDKQHKSVGKSAEPIEISDDEKPPAIELSVSGEKLDTTLLKKGKVSASKRLRLWKLHESEKQCDNGGNVRSVKDLEQIRRNYEDLRRDFEKKFLEKCLLKKVPIITVINQDEENLPKNPSGNYSLENQPASQSLSNITTILQDSQVSMIDKLALNSESLTVETISDVPESLSCASNVMNYDNNVESTTEPIVNNPPKTIIKQGGKKIVLIQSHIIQKPLLPETGDKKENSPNKNKFVMPTCLPITKSMLLYNNGATTLDPKPVHNKIMRNLEEAKYVPLVLSSGALTTSRDRQYETCVNIEGDPLLITPTLDTVSVDAAPMADQVETVPLMTENIADTNEDENDQSLENMDFEKLIDGATIRKNSQNPKCAASIIEKPFKYVVSHRSEAASPAGFSSGVKSANIISKVESNSGIPLITDFQWRNMTIAQKIATHNSKTVFVSKPSESVAVFPNEQPKTLPAEKKAFVKISYPTGNINIPAVVVKPKVLDKSKRNIVTVDMSNKQLEEKKLQVVNAKKKVYVCDWCDDNFNTMLALETHYKKHKVFTMMVNKTADASVTPEVSEPMYRCRRCLMSFLTEVELKIHEPRYKEDLPHCPLLKCNTCKTRCESDLDIQLHKEQHSIETCNRMCKLCKTEFDHVPDLWKHMKAHTKHNIYGCETCGRVFLSEYHLEKHSERHVSEKYPFYCSFCYMRFWSAVTLRRHVHDCSIRNAP